MVKIGWIWFERGQILSFLCFASGQIPENNEKYDKNNNILLTVTKCDAVTKYKNENVTLKNGLAMRFFGVFWAVTT